MYQPNVESNEINISWCVEMNRLQGPCARFATHRSELNLRGRHPERDMHLHPAKIPWALLRMNLGTGLPFLRCV
jgi:hypothetical protein